MRVPPHATWTNPPIVAATASQERHRQSCTSRPRAVVRPVLRRRIISHERAADYMGGVPGTFAPFTVLFHKYTFSALGAEFVYHDPPELLITLS